MRTPFTIRRWFIDLVIALAFLVVTCVMLVQHAEIQRLKTGHSHPAPVGVEMRLEHLERLAEYQQSAIASHNEAIQNHNKAIAHINGAIEHLMALVKMALRGRF